jgi:hypothetical protein
MLLCVTQATKKLQEKDVFKPQNQPFSPEARQTRLDNERLELTLTLAGIETRWIERMNQKSNQT